MVKVVNEPLENLFKCYPDMSVDSPLNGEGVSFR